MQTERQNCEIAHFNHDFQKYKDFYIKVLGKSSYVKKFGNVENDEISPEMAPSLLIDFFQIASLGMDPEQRSLAANTLFTTKFNYTSQIGVMHFYVEVLRGYLHLIMKYEFPWRQSLATELDIKLDVYTAYEIIQEESIKFDFFQEEILEPVTKLLCSGGYSVSAVEISNEEYEKKVNGSCTVDEIIEYELVDLITHMIVSWRKITVFSKTNYLNFPLISLIRYFLGNRNLDLKDAVLERWNFINGKVFTSLEQYTAFYSVPRDPIADINDIFNIL